MISMIDERLEQLHTKPYPGLRPFRRNEYFLFFGRDACLNRMIDTLNRHHFLAVLGASGSGKSSLVRTAFFEELSMGFAGPADMDWQIADLEHPSETRPFAELAVSLIKSRPGEAREWIPQGEVDALEKELQGSQFALQHWAQNEANVAPGHNLLILVDQFEELFNFDSEGTSDIGFDRDHVDRFVNLLMRTVEMEKSNIFIVITMRAEFLNLCTTFAGLAERLSEDMIVPPRMSRDDLQAGIVGPQRVLLQLDSPNKFEFDDFIVEELLNDLAALAQADDKSERIDQTERLARQADQLPVMQHALNRMWALANARRTSDETIVLTRDDYLTQGRAAGMLRTQGDEVYQSLTLRQRMMTERIFRSLVRGPSVARAVRRPCTIPTLTLEAQLLDEPEVTEEEVRMVVDRFRADEVCFVTPYGTAPISDTRKISISHESLIRQWPMLKIWCQAEVDAGIQWNAMMDSLAREEREGAGTAGFVERALSRLQRRKTSAAVWTGAQLEDRNIWFDRNNPQPGWAARYPDQLGSNRFEDVAALRHDSNRWTGFRNQVLTGALIGAVMVSGAAYAYSVKATTNAATKIANAQAQVTNANDKFNNATKSLADAKTTQASATVALAQANAKLSEATQNVAAAKTTAEMALRKAVLAEGQAKGAAAVAQAQLRLASQAESRARVATQSADLASQKARKASLTFLEQCIGDKKYTREGAYEQAQEMFATVLQDRSALPEKEASILLKVPMTGSRDAIDQLSQPFLTGTIADLRTAVAAGQRSGDAVETSGANIDLLLSQGRLYLWQGNPVAARKEFKQVLAGRSSDDQVAAGFADPDVTDQVVASAWAGIAEADLAADSTDEKIPPVCPEMPVVSETYIASVEEVSRFAAFAQCHQSRARWQFRFGGSGSSASRQMLSLATQLYSYTNLLDQVTIQRAITETFITQGDLLKGGVTKKVLGPSSLFRPSTNASTAYANAAFSNYSSSNPSLEDRVIKSQGASWRTIEQIELASSIKPYRVFDFSGNSHRDIHNFALSRIRFANQMASSSLLRSVNRSSQLSQISHALDDAYQGVRDLDRMIATDSTIDPTPVLIANGKSGEEWIRTLLDGAKVAPKIFDELGKYSADEEAPDAVIGGYRARIFNVSLQFLNEAIRIQNLRPASAEVQADIQAVADALAKTSESDRFAASYQTYPDIYNFFVGKTPWGRHTLRRENHGADLKNSVSSLCEFGQDPKSVPLNQECDVLLRKAHNVSESLVGFHTKLSEYRNSFAKAGRGVWSDRWAVALGGIDPVDCVKQKPGESGYCILHLGSPLFPLLMKDAIWLFRSAKNRETFQAKSSLYVPQFSGHDFVSPSEDDQPLSRPTLLRNGTVLGAGRLVDRKLYIVGPVFRYLDEAEFRKRLREAEARWSKWKESPESSPSLLSPLDNVQAEE